MRCWKNTRGENDLSETALVRFALLHFTAGLAGADSPGRKRRRCALPEGGHAASIPGSPGLDKGSVNEICWYGTLGMIEPRVPRLS
jgi:hypothetical protein